MSNLNVHLIRGMYDALARGDIAAVLGTFDPHIEFRLADNSLYGGRKPHVGTQAIVENVFARLAVDWDDFSIRIDELIDAGDKVIVLGYYSGTYKATGKPILAQMAHIWTVRGDKLVRMQQYTDTKQFAEISRREAVATT